MHLSLHLLPYLEMVSFSLHTSHYFFFLRLILYWVRIGKVASDVSQFNIVIDNGRVFYYSTLWWLGMILTLNIMSKYGWGELNIGFIFVKGVIRVYLLVDVGL